MPMPMVVCESDAIGDAIGVATRERETRDAKADVWRARGRRVGARRRRPRRAHRDATFESTDTQKKRFFLAKKRHSMPRASRGDVDAADDVGPVRAVEDGKTRARAP